MRVLIALGLVVAFATGVYADKVVNRTYYTAVLGDVNTVAFVRDAASATGWKIIARAGIRASDGAGYDAQVSADATAGQKTTIESFIGLNVLGPLNTQEGL